MTRKSFSWLVVLLLIATLPLAACNRSAAPDVTEMDELMSQEAASNAETEVPVEEVATEEPTEEVTEEPTEVVTEEPTPEVTEEPTEVATEEPTEVATLEATPEVTVVATEEATPVVATGSQVHTVQRGENLFRIAQRYGVTVEALAQANGVTNPAFIYAGQQLTIPGSGTPTTPSQPPVGGNVHVVQLGENLFRIALKYNLDYYYLARYNNITNPAMIYVGQPIRIP